MPRSLVVSKLNKDQAGHISTILQVLKEKNLYAKLSKCEFWLREVSFLGHVISSGGITIHPSMVDAML